MLSPGQFLDLTASPAEPSGGLGLRYGKVAAGYTTGRPTVVMDGETVATAALPYLASYTPAANDRVAVLVRGASKLVLGKVL